jgi:hypothetical protein
MVEEDTEARKAQQLAVKHGLKSPGTSKTSVSILCAEFRQIYNDVINVRQ